MYYDQGGKYEIVQEHYKCHLPPKPPNSLILNFNKKKSEQKWQRIPLPDYYQERHEEELYKRQQQQKLVNEGHLKAITHVDHVLEKYRRNEWHRRVYGVWFFNNGVPTYVTGVHYFYLQWCQFDHEENNGYPLYYDSQRKRFYFREYCQTDPHCLGYIIVGPRGFGKSSEETGVMLESLTRPPKRRTGAIQSKTESDAQQTLFKEKFVPTLNALPEFFKPISAHGTNPEKRLSWAEPSKTGNKKNRSTNKGLLNFLYPVSAKEKALDGRTLSDILQDEIGKTDPRREADVEKRMRVNRFCVYRNNRKRGMIRGTTTVEYMDEGGRECHNVYLASDPTDRTKNGFTISGLYKFFVSALDVGTDFADDYGFIDERACLAKHMAEREARENNMVEFNSYLRKNPLNEAEAFIKDASKCVFNVMVITNRLEELHRIGRRLYTQGNFEWVDGKKDGVVEFVRDDQNGRFMVSYLLDEADTNPEAGRLKSNKVRRDFDSERKVQWYPLNDRYFGIGGDPIKFNKTVDPRASKAGAIGFRKYDNSVDKDVPLAEWRSHMIMFEYLHRPEEFEVYGEDMIKACRYYGCSINPESNVTTLDQYFTLRGYEHFLTRREDFDITVLAGKKDDTGVTSQPETITNYVQRIQTFVNRHGHRIPFPRILQQLLDFDPTNTTRSDLVVSLGYALLEIEKNIEEELPTDNVDDWFDAFDNSGTKSAYYGEEYANVIEEDDDLTW
jgi:hypothetical protein